MADQKKLCVRIRSAKSWLSHAEDSFIRENNVRGEISLLLAEAELQRLRETKGRRLTNRRRHIIAAGTAFVIAGVFWWTMGFLAVKPPPEPPQREKTVKKADIAEIIAASAPPKAVVLAPEKTGAIDNSMPPPAAFGEQELRVLTKEAGKVLRHGN